MKGFGDRRTILAEVTALAKVQRFIEEREGAAPRVKWEPDCKRT